MGEQKNGQIKKWIDRHTDNQMVRWTYRQTDGWMNREIDG